MVVPLKPPLPTHRLTPAEARSEASWRAFLERRMEGGVREFFQALGCCSQRIEGHLEGSLVGQGLFLLALALVARELRLLDDERTRALHASLHGCWPEALVYSGELTQEEFDEADRRCSDAEAILEEAGRKGLGEAARSVAEGRQEVAEWTRRKREYLACVEAWARDLVKVQGSLFRHLAFYDEDRLPSRVARALSALLLVREGRFDVSLQGRTGGRPPSKRVSREAALMCIAPLPGRTPSQVVQELAGPLGRRALVRVREAASRAIGAGAFARRYEMGLLLLAATGDDYALRLLRPDAKHGHRNRLQAMAQALGRIRRAPKKDGPILDSHTWSLLRTGLVDFVTRGLLDLDGITAEDETWLLSRGRLTVPVRPPPRP